MNFSLTYLINRFFYRVFDFLRDWYVGGFLAVGGAMIGFLGTLDEFFAWKITLRNILEPLYQDHTIIGHALGFTLRSARLFAGTFVYAFVFLVAAVVYFAWAAIPVIIIYKGFL